MPGRGSYKALKDSWLVVGIVNVRTRNLQGAVGRLVSFWDCQCQDADPTRRCRTAG
jgi:hypothetical protein